MKTFLIALSLISFSAYSGVLPDIFYKSPLAKEAFCKRPEFKTESYWRRLMANKIDALINGGSEAKQNAFVSLSYLQLFETPSQHRAASYMGYVYANASHHLGRLVRFAKWPKNHPLRKSDRELVKGELLRLAADNVSDELSSRLMYHSLDLYKELSWSLASSVLCGQSYALSIVKDKNLIRAYNAKGVTDFIHPFVTYEQTYLQENMYSDFLIGHTAKMKVLDEMRFITFNGEEHESFAAWCNHQKCNTSSYNLRNRIIFDAYSIKKEIVHFNSLRKRAAKAQIVSTARYFINKRD